MTTSKKPFESYGGPPASMSEAQELNWWRIFATKFVTPLPEPGTVLGERKFALYVEAPEGREPYGS